VITSRPTWRKSTYSGPDNECVEVATLDAMVGVRDSKDITRPSIRYGSAAWTRFATSLGIEHIA
jgi:hypothetical protein